MPSPAPAPNLPSRPQRTARSSGTRRRIFAVTSLGLAGLLAGLLSGCSTQTTSTASTSTAFAQASGNWQFSSSATASARLSSFGGSLSVEGNTVTGTLHALSSKGQCVGTSIPLPVTGSIDGSRRLTLTGPLSGGTLNLSGTLAEDGKSLTGASYGVRGGACPLSTPTISARDSGAPVTAQQYQPVSGTYTGTLTTSDGQTFTLTSNLTQTSQPDSNGVYHVSGTAASPGNTCVPNSLPATASTIDGGSISTTYTDPATGTSITASGTTSPDGQAITLSNWTIQSPCGSDTGTGTLTLTHSS